MSNAQRFIAAFNEIDRALREMCCVDKYTPFRVLVKQAGKQNAPIKKLQFDLQEFSELRNAIVHQSRQESAIAEPADWAVNQIEHIAKLLTDPPKLLSLFAKEVLTFSADDLVGQAVKEMSTHRFSQVPVYDGAVYLGLLTTESLVFWLGAVGSFEAKLSQVTLRDVFLSRHNQAYEHFLSRTASLCDLIELFEHSAEGGKRLDAVLITENGRSQEKLLGIVTMADLPQVYKEVGQYVGE